MVLSSATAPLALTHEQIEAYHRDGYLIVRELISPAEIAVLTKRFEDLGREGKTIPNHWEPDLSDEGSKDPLRRYPRVMMPHRFDPMTQSYLLDPRVLNILRDLLDDEPLAAQSMYYYKPTGARGQAFHQDDYYLRTQGGDCIAAWIALDPSTPENGGLSVCPGTHRENIACPEPADTTTSFSTELVRPPLGHEPIPAILNPGDTLFFNGRVIHGSTPNTHPTLWRRSLINHYIPAKAVAVSQWYFPLLDKDGHQVDRNPVNDGGPCGKEDPKSSYAP